MQAYAATYRQALRNAEVLVLVSATFAYLGAFFSIGMYGLEHGGDMPAHFSGISFSLIYPFVDIGLVVLLALLMMVTKSLFAAIALLSYYALRLILTATHAEYEQSIFTLSFLVIQVIGLFSVIKYRKLLPFAKAEAEMTAQYCQGQIIGYPVQKKRQSVSAIVLGAIMLSLCFNPVFIPFGIIGLVVAYAYKDTLRVNLGVALNAIGLVVCIIIALSQLIGN